MSFHDHSPGYPPSQTESQYPLPPGEEEDRARFYHQRESSNGGPVTLPSILPYEHSYSPQPPQSYTQEQRVYPPDSSSSSFRASSTPALQPEFSRTGAAQPLSFSQSAPRQRTAIACRYCRRRKIRCSGFDQNPDGRCVNCQRFQQECIFTPVSSQAQAFVPAHAVYPGMRNMGIGPDGRPRPMYPQGAPLFGAHGQPLPAPQAQQIAPYEYPPSCSSAYNTYPGDDRNSQPPPDISRKRVQPKPHPSILPRPIPVQVSFPRAETAPRRGTIDEDLRLPPVTPTAASSASNYSPGSSHSSHSNLQPPHKSSLPYISRTPPPRSSPGESRGDPMSLGNIMERRPDIEIDRSMLGRLDRKGQ